MKTAIALVGVAAILAACDLESHPPRSHTHDARFGFLAGSGAGPDHATLCRAWRRAVSTRDPSALSHVSFADAVPESSCFVPIRYTDTAITVGAIPRGCAYPRSGQIERLRSLAEQLDEVPPAHSTLLPCGITEADRAASIAHNARVLRSASARMAAHDAPDWPYGAVVTFGYGWPDQITTSVADWKPGDRCHAIDQNDIDRLGVMVIRARRVADALRADVAPLAIVSGGTPHSRMVEAFALLFLLHCELGVPSDRVLLEPCAEHTHTNLRNSGRWLAAMGMRTAYVVTDDGFQRDAFEDFSEFDLVFGSMDQRSLRDWGDVLGAWRRAAVGPNVGYWFTPYRFWAEPVDGLGSVTCDDTP